MAEWVINQNTGELGILYQGKPRKVRVKKNEDGAMKALTAEGWEDVPTHIANRWNALQRVDPTEGMTDKEIRTVRLGRGARDVHAGVKQMYLEATDPEAAEEFTKKEGEDIRLYESTIAPEGFDWSRLAGEISQVPIPPLAKGPAAVRYGLQAAAGGAQAGVPFVPEGGSRSQRAWLGAGLGLAGQIAPELFGRGVNKVVNRQAGVTNLKPGAEDAAKFADEQGLPIHLDDVSKSDIVHGIGDALDEISVVGKRTQREQQQQMAREFSEEHLEMLRRQAGAGDPVEVLGQSATRRQQQLFKQDMRKYRAAYNELDPGGPLDMSQEPARALADLADEVRRMGDIAPPDLLRKLEILEEAAWTGRGSTGHAFRFSDWHEARSYLGDWLDAARAGKGKSIGTKASGKLEQAYKAVTEGMEANARRISPRGMGLWREADEFHKNVIVKYKASRMHRAVEAGDPEDFQAVFDAVLGRGQRILSTDSAAVAKEVYRGLDNPGRKMFRFEMFRRALDTAIDGDKFSPAALSSSLKFMKKRMGVFFNAEEMQFFKGLQNYLAHIREAGGAGARYKTGRSLMNPGAGVAAGIGIGVGSVKTVAAVAGSLKGLTWLFTNPRARSLVTAMGRVTPESREAFMVAQLLGQVLPRGLAGASASASPQGVDRTSDGRETVALTQ